MVLLVHKNDKLGAQSLRNKKGGGCGGFFRR